MAILATLHALVTTPRPIPCPTWCMLPVGHAPEVVDEADGSALVVHRAVVLADSPTGRRLDLAQVVTVRPDRSTSTELPVVVVDGEVDNTLTLEQARRQAAALVCAADAIVGGAR